MIRLQAKERKALIANAAVEVANTKGLVRVGFVNVAEVCPEETSARTVQHYFRIADLRKAAAYHPDASNNVKLTAVKLGIMPATDLPANL